MGSFRAAGLSHGRTVLKSLKRDDHSPAANPGYTDMLVEYGPFFIQLGLAIVLALAFLKGAALLGPSRPNRIKQMPYESGMDPIGTARARYSVKFYLVAMIFIVFDVEVVFLYPWAASFRNFLEAGIGLEVLGVVTIFVIILAIGLVYDIKKGGLEFD
ncbi:MAG: NADH-quinone oxidoreductase subunit A [Rhodothermia bacterium]|nr:MAG: NADH-quinone oxidoreductase subunit A [Rhodothermia bacterium]